MLVRDVMQTSVVRLPPDTPADVAARKLRGAKVGSLVVVEGGTAVGILTERDVVWKIVAEGIPTSTLVRDVMSRAIRTIPDDTPIEEAAEILRVARIRHLVVISGSKIVGMLGTTDIARALPAIERGLTAAWARPWID